MSCITFNNPNYFCNKSIHIITRHPDEINMYHKKQPPAQQQMLQIPTQEAEILLQAYIFRLLNSHVKQYIGNWSLNNLIFLNYRIHWHSTITFFLFLISSTIFLLSEVSVVQYESWSCFSPKKKKKYNISLELINQYRSVWIQLIIAKTENWKYCNKIIFKYVNSAVGSIFNIFKCVNSAVTVH